MGTEKSTSFVLETMPLKQRKQHADCRSLHGPAFSPQTEWSLKWPVEIPSHHIRNAANFKVEKKSSTLGTSLLFLYSQTLCVTFYMGYTKTWLTLSPPSQHSAMSLEPKKVPLSVHASLQSFGDG